MEAWISDFSKHVKMKEPRLEKRLIKIVENFSKKPASSIPEACCSHSETTAAYRFFDNSRVSANDIRDSFLGETLEKIKKEKFVLIPTDITGLNYFTHRSLKGTGPMRSQRSKGLVLASSLAVDKKGTPLGLIFQKLWGRSGETGPEARAARKKLPIEKRESYVWIESLKKIENTIPKDKIGIMIGDRGSDFYDFFNYERNHNIELLIRAKTNRSLRNDNLKLFERMASGKADGITLVNVGRSRKNKARSAKVEIRFKKVEIDVPVGKPKSFSFKPVTLYTIEAKEIKVPKNVSNPILWRLVTTMPVKSITNAIEKVIWYAKRWLIERYHYALKSGCKVEELQLESIGRIEKALTVYCLIAWRLLFLTYKSRNNPHESCEKYFTKDEWTSCYIFLSKRKPPNKPPNLKEFIVMIAQLGGFLARKSDGDPGVKVIWRGLKRLEDISASFVNFKEVLVYNG